MFDSNYREAFKTQLKKVSLKDDLQEILRIGLLSSEVSATMLHEVLKAGASVTFPLWQEYDSRSYPRPDKVDPKLRLIFDNLEVNYLPEIPHFKLTYLENEIKTHYGSSDRLLFLKLMKHRSLNLSTAVLRHISSIYL